MMSQSVSTDNHTRPAVLAVGDLRADPASRRCWRGDTEITLTTKEFGLIELLMRRPGAVLTRELLLGLRLRIAVECR